MKKETIQTILNKLTPKQREGLKILTESGKLEELVKDLERNLELTTSPKSIKTDSE